MLIKFTDPIETDQPIYISKHALEDVQHIERDEIGEQTVTVIYFLNRHKVAVLDSIETVRTLIEEKDEPFRLTPQTEPLV